MSSNKLTPEQAWQHVKAIMPFAKALKKRNALFNSHYIELPHDQFIELLCCEIEWPDGMYSYPPEPEKQWRAAVMPADWGRRCRVKNHGSTEWQETYVLGCTMNGKRWFADNRNIWDQCEVPVDEPPTIRESQIVEDGNRNPQPMSTAPKDRAIELFMGGGWVVGSFEPDSKIWASRPVYNKSIAWDRGNQPSAWREISDPT